MKVCQATSGWGGVGVGMGVERTRCLWGRVLLSQISVVGNLFCETSASDGGLAVKSALFSVAGLWSPHSTTVGVGTAQSCIDLLYNQQHLLFYVQFTLILTLPCSLEESSETSGAVLRLFAP